MRRLFLIWMAVLPLLTYAVTPLENLKIAADGGIADAQYDLAVLYETGEQGLKKSTKQAYYWYEKAAKGGNEKAKAWLAKVTKKSDQQRVEQARVEKAAQDKQIAKEQRRQRRAAAAAAQDRQAKQVAEKQVGAFANEMISIGNFSMGKYEVTQGQWQAIMGNNPSSFAGCGTDCPVEQVSWDDVQTFLSTLNERTGKRYRLPTESEWEQACGMGSEYCGSNDLDAVAWYDGNSDNTSHPVGLRQPNSHGLYDMSGNLWEWVSNCYNGNCGSHVLRGASWSNDSETLRSAFHGESESSAGYNNIGFRLAHD